MILRNRNLNVQEKKDNTQQKTHLKPETNAKAAVKRQAAQIIQGIDENEHRYEPKLKQACNSSVSIVQFSLSKKLCIDSAKKDSQLLIGFPYNKENVKPLDAICEEQNASEEVEKRRESLKALDYDFDKENERDFTAVSDYASDIFRYYKYQERFYRVSDYMTKHLDLNQMSRSQIVNWLVELQETFELNHETLYLTVKLFDLFMDRTTGIVRRPQLRLIASAAMFVASKFDERSPPLIDDFIYMSEESYTREQLMAMERELLKIVDFDLGAPLSYRFLRRYARVSKLDMGTLTLARYVLETSLMSFEFCRMSESLIAAACLLLAMRMKGIGDWTRVQYKYTGYKIVDVEQVMWELNNMMLDRRVRFSQLDMAYRKYSHEIFFEVAKIPPLEL